MESMLVWLSLVALILEIINNLIDIYKKAQQDKQEVAAPAKKRHS